MNNKKYMVLLIDRKNALFFSLIDGRVDNKTKILPDNVPQKVKHGDDTWDQQNKINRHIEDHLHWHLDNIVKQAVGFIQKNDIKAILIGGRKSLFTKTVDHFPYPYKKKIKGEFVTGLKAPFNEIVEKAEKAITKITPK